MKLTRFTDYTLRVLVFLGAYPDRRITIREIARSYGISRNHLMKIVHHLSSEGVIDTKPGKAGGMKLAKAPEDISIGAVVRRAEPHMNILECFVEKHESCPLVLDCLLADTLVQARERFLQELDQCTLAQVLQPLRQQQLSSDPVNLLTGCGASCVKHNDHKAISG